MPPMVSPFKFLLSSHSTKYAEGFEPRAPPLPFLVSSIPSTLGSGVPHPRVPTVLYARGDRYQQLCLNDMFILCVWATPCGRARIHPLWSTWNISSN